MEKHNEWRQHLTKTLYVGFSFHFSPASCFKNSLQGRETRVVGVTAASLNICVLVSFQIKRLETRLSKTDCTDSEGRERTDGERWKKDSCTICECRVRSTYKTKCSANGWQTHTHSACSSHFSHSQKLIMFLVSPCFSLRAGCPSESFLWVQSAQFKCPSFSLSDTLASVSPLGSYPPPGTGVSSQCLCAPATSLPPILYLWHFFSASYWQRWWQLHAKPGFLWSFPGLSFPPTYLLLPS